MNLFWVLEVSSLLRSTTRIRVAGKICVIEELHGVVNIQSFGHNIYIYISTDKLLMQIF